MIQLDQLQWLKIHDFLLDIEKAWEPKGFCTQVMAKLHMLLPYDKARIYIINKNGQISYEFLYGVEKRWSENYLSYYSKIENNRYSIFRNSNYANPEIHGSVTDWDNHTIDEFVTRYIKPQGIKHSLGFTLYGDAFGKGIFCFDRTSGTGYQTKELGIISIVHPHIQNLLRNSFVAVTRGTSHPKNPDSKSLLTKREHEIAELLYKGVSPINISNQLFISLSTTYRHIANIHAKLNVSSRQELIIALFGYFQDGTNLTLT
ncbi:Response regulator containing a CheY-like receiver domain and an HTH DNA-binding domain [Desulfitobacterium sp. LBE]|uniref:helix-turn-helix domain-containing protein n=1 Tax=Desulfitobacterium sp. LBE TaxID=884086 RepID=UPI00119A9113|nr:helix-turn-helix transcriptional regulator [Desulfitobacterium sp. LBE]TWH56993.1 Response regulator containing a CheY-like receiver domain and an HTH DNA-binding domain [Desulfitobacterium sp. LBE]